MTEAVPAGPPVRPRTNRTSPTRARPDTAVLLNTGIGGLARVVVTTASAHAEIYLQGAHVTAWAPTGETPVIWTSAHSTFAPGVPIRGGVPVCFPWFGPHPSGDGPLHGLVRDQPWTFTDWTWSEHDDVALTFTLSSSDLPGAAEPFALRYTVTVGSRLRLALQVTNTGVSPLVFEEALHTYLAVSDLRETHIEGLGDLDRLDRLRGHRAHTPAGARFHVVGETDHLYSRPGPVTVVDWPARRSVRVVAQGSGNAVVWNPWVDKAAAMPDFGTDEWSQMVCVETCNVADQRVNLPPRAEHTLETTLEIHPVP